MDEETKFAYPTLPLISELYSHLNEEECSQEDYEHAKEVWRLLNLQNVGEYSDEYLKTDVLVPVDVLQNLRKFSIDKYGLGSAHYATISSFWFDACLKFTEVAEVEL